MKKSLSKKIFHIPLHQIPLARGVKNSLFQTKKLGIILGAYLRQSIALETFLRGAEPNSTLLRSSARSTESR